MSQPSHRTLRHALVGAALFGVAGLAGAATIVVNPGNPLWSSLPGENNAGSSTVISSTAPKDTNGSLELSGDRTRFSMGNYYNPASNLGLLDQVLSLTYQWQVAVGSTNGYHPDYTPALRLHIYDNGQRSELIWEGAYNGVYGNMDEGTWYASGINDKFYRNVAGSGVTLQNSSQVNQTIFDWANALNASGAKWYSDAAYVSAISVGSGSGTGLGYHAFVDNVTFGINGVTNTYNFETAAVAVPEPATLALAGLALAAAGFARRRRVAA